MQQMLTLTEMEVFLGERIRALRLQKNLDRQTVCKMAGVSLNALRHLESGRGARIKTLLLVSRALGHLDWIASLAPPVSINPLHMVRGKPQRQRASGRRIKKDV